MNTILVAITSFSLGLVLGATFFAVCSSPAFDFETQQNQREQEQRQRQESQRLERQQNYWQEQNNPSNRYLSPC